MPLLPTGPPKLEYIEFKIRDSPCNQCPLPYRVVFAVFYPGLSMAHFNNEAEFAGVLGHEIGQVTGQAFCHTTAQSHAGPAGNDCLEFVLSFPNCSEFVEPFSQECQLHC